MSLVPDHTARGRRLVLGLFVVSALVTTAMLVLLTVVWPA